MTHAIGKATVWFCDPNHWSADGSQNRGCGYFGFYKPEFDVDVVMRECPSCRRREFYNKTNDLAEFGIVVDGIEEIKVNLLEREEDEVH